MATHRKTPLFLRIVTHDKAVVCINPHQLSSFQILEKASIKVKSKVPMGEDKVIEADTIRFYFPSGTGLSYSVGLDLTQEEFNYVCTTLLEFLYLNEAEFKARSQAIAEESMKEWETLSNDNEAKLIPATPPKE